MTISVHSNARKTPKNKQRGNGLLYTLLGSALLAIGSYAAYGIYQDKTLSASIQADVTNVQDIAQLTQRIFGQSNDFGGQTTATVVQSGAIPGRLRVAGTNTANNSFSQAITAAPADGTGTNDLMSFTWPVPRAACGEFITAIATFARRIDVGATAVKVLDTKLVPGTMSAQCDLTATPVVKFYIGRTAALAQ